MSLTKEKFILKLSLRLKDLDTSDIEKACEFYSKMIDDRVDDGMSKEEAIEALGPMDYIEASIRDNIRNNASFTHICNNDTLDDILPIKEKRELNGSVLILLILSFPIWFSLIVLALALALAIFIGIWAVVCSSYIANAALGVGGLATLLSGFGFLFTGNFSPAVLAISEALLLIGAGLVLFVALKYITRLGLWATRGFTGFLRGILFGGINNA